MDFFTRLRRLASKVEKDVASIQASLNEPIKRRDSSDNRALVILRGMQQDVHDSMEKAQQIKQSLCEKPDLAALVTLSRALLERETEIYEETVEYLQQYGYVRADDTTTTNKEYDLQNKVESVQSDNAALPTTPEPSPQRAASPVAPTQISTPVAPLLSKYARAAISTSDVEPPQVCLDNSPCTPEFTTPGLQRYLQQRPQLLVEENGQLVGTPQTVKTLPVPPVIQTPGFRQLGTPQDDPMEPSVGDIFNDLPAMTPVNSHHPSLNTAISDSPQMPELNFTIQDLRKMTSQTKLFSDSTSTSSATYDLTTHNDNMIQPTNVLRLANQANSTDSDIPEMPELTFNLATYVATKCNR